LIGDYSRRGERRRRQATVNAAKADGQIDEDEVRRIVGKLQEIGVDPGAQRYAMTELQKPMETEEWMAAAQGRPDLGAQMYGASLLGIEVDTRRRRSISSGWPPVWVSTPRSPSTFKDSSGYSRFETHWGTDRSFPSLNFRAVRVARRCFAV